MTGAGPRTALDAVLWPQQSRAFDGGERLNTVRTAQVVIIGAGYSGLSSALHLAEAGYDVAVIEADRPGSGASGRNAAGWFPTYFDKAPQDVAKLLGAERGAALNGMITDGARLVPTLVARHRMVLDLRATGIIQASGDASQAPQHRQLAASWNGCGGNVGYIGTDKLRHLIDSDRFTHGLLFRDAGTLDPFAYATALAGAAVKAGAKLYTATPAMGVAAEGALWRVTTPHGAILAPQVLIATEGYAANATLWPGLEKTSYSVPVSILASDPVPEFVQRVMPAGIPLTDTNRANPLWMMADRDGRLVASLLPPRNYARDPAKVAIPLEQKLRRLFGPLPALRWSHFWVGNVALSAERIARLLSLAPGVHAIGGYSGQGIATATIAGQEYARLIQAEGDPAACRLPIFAPRALPLRLAVPFLVRHVAAPLGRLIDRSYRTIPDQHIADEPQGG